jgi:RNase P subunit RPR2
MRKKISKEIVEEVNFIFDKANESNEIEAKKLVKEAREIAKRKNYRMPIELRDKFCNKCNSFFNGKNIKIRISHDKISKKCLECGYVSRRKFKIS